MRHQIIIVLAAVFSGCTTAPVNPLAARYLMTAAVVKAVENSPNTRRYLEAVQPVACNLATGKDVTPAQIAEAIGKVTDGKTADTVASANVIMAIYVSFAAPHGTNAPNASAFAQAVFCDGMFDGLASPSSAPRGARRNAAPANVKADWLVK